MLCWLGVLLEAFITAINKSPQLEHFLLIRHIKCLFAIFLFCARIRERPHSPKFYFYKLFSFFSLPQLILVISRSSRTCNERIPLGVYKMSKNKNRTEKENTEVYLGPREKRTHFPGLLDEYF